MNVLSLFDGMSCGQIALNRAGVKYDKYFASEIDKHAIQVTMANYPDTIQIGEIAEVTASALPKIDLVIGGSPCQGFSFAGKQLNFNDPRSKLFFEFVRILNEVRAINPNAKFLLENVKMKKEFLDVITSHLGVEPVFVCSSLVSGQKRKRWYWTNISTCNPIDRGILMSHVLEPLGLKQNEKLYLNETQISRALRKHAAQTYKTGTKMGRVSFPTDTTKKAKPLTRVNVTGSRETNHVQDSFGIRLLTTSERERLQTVPVGYTSGVPDAKAWEMLGNGWTVDLISHIFKSLSHNAAQEAVK